MIEATGDGIAFGGLDPGLAAISSHFDIENWTVLAESPGYVRVEVPLHDRLQNRRSQLFGGYTPAYVDMLAFRVARSGTHDQQDTFYATTSMRVDYLEAITEERFEIEARLIRARGRNAITEARFFQKRAVAVFATTTLLAMPPTPGELAGS